MSCLHPILIPNQSKSLNFGESAILSVPCGKCENCKSSYVKSWQIRAYFEAQDTINSGGYIINDTLTYSEKSCPRFLGQRCFSTRHIQLFMKSLREDIKRQYGKRLDFSYFITSEYGSKNTQRPHYHALFFVKSSFVDPITFSDLISKHWKSGRTDGAKYNGVHYVLSKRVLSDSSSAHAVSCYITKYFTKSQYLTDRLTSLVDSYVVKRFGQDYWKNYDHLLFRRKLLRTFGHSLKVSKGFGSYLLTQYSSTQLVDNNFTIISDRKIRHLPRYYKRKTLQFWKRNKDKSYSWFYNSLGVSYLKKLHANQDEYNTNYLVSRGLTPSSDLLLYMRRRGKIVSYDMDSFNPENYDPQIVKPFSLRTTVKDKYMFGGRFVAIDTFEHPTSVLSSAGDYITFEEFKKYIYLLPQYEKLLENSPTPEQCPIDIKHEVRRLYDSTI